jgi:hypothetical protein
LDGSRRLTRRRRSSFGSSSDFKFSTGASGSGTIITDPSVVAGGVQSANAALFGNYIAASFVTAAGGQGGAVFGEEPQTQPLLFTTAIKGRKSRRLRTTLLILAADALDRLSRYEATLWRQVLQTLLLFCPNDLLAKPKDRLAQAV